MLSRVGMKEQAKQNLVGFWGLSIVAFLIYTIVLGSGANFAYSFRNGFQISGNQTSFLITVFLSPLIIGYFKIHYMIARKKDVDLEELLFGFRFDYFTKVIVLFLKRLFIFLWSLLFVIPGIIKALSYGLTEFIIQDDYFKEDALNAMRLSEKMMFGHKMDLLLLILSFFWWYVLVMITFGVALLYVAPYMLQTFAVFYEEVKKEYCLEHNIGYKYE